MSEAPGSRAAEITASQVESVVAAAQEAAARLTDDARREADHVKAQARREAKELTDAAKRRAEQLLAEAERDAGQLREQARRTIESRVAEAEETAAQVLDEARSLRGGLKRLGLALGEQGERLLREVQAAHRRMQADLRVDLGEGRSVGDLERRDRTRRGRSRRAGTPDLEVPSWVARER